MRDRELIATTSAIAYALFAADHTTGIPLQALVNTGARDGTREMWQASSDITQSAYLERARVIEHFLGGRVPVRPIFTPPEGSFSSGYAAAYPEEHRIWPQPYSGPNIAAIYTTDRPRGIEAMRRAVLRGEPMLAAPVKSTHLEAVPFSLPLKQGGLVCWIGWKEILVTDAP